MINITKDDLRQTKEERINLYLKAEEIVKVEMEDEGWKVDESYESINKYNREFNERVLNKQNKLRLESYNAYDKIVIRLIGNMYIEMFGEEESEDNAEKLLKSDVFWKLEDNLVNMLGLTKYNFFETLESLFGSGWAN